MAKENVPLFAFNRGMISKLGMARTDIERTRLSAEVQTNMIPRVLGSMMLRPGWEMIDRTLDDQTAVHIPFIFSDSDTAIIEVTDEALRVLVDEAVISRPAVSTAVTSGDFSSATGWTDADETGATSTISGGQLSLVGTGYAAAIRRQQVTVAGGDQNVEHALRIAVVRGPVIFRCGSTSGGDEYISETTLGTGTHSLAFTPTGNFYVQFSGLRQAAALVDSCTVEAAGDMVIDVPWTEDDLPYIQVDQSADVIYVACTTAISPRKIERRGTRSWSVVEYFPENGPFRIPNTGTTRLSASAISGDITLTASRALFRPAHVGALFRHTSIGQLVEASFTAEAQFSDPIRITGVGASQRTFEIVRSGTWTATVTLQRSVGEPGAWIDVATYTTNATTNYNDGLDNQIIYYRLGVKTGDFTSGQADVSMSYASGGITGTARVTGYTSATEVSAAVLTALGGTDGSEIWSEGAWSGLRGYISALRLYGNRFYGAGKGRIYGSVADAYEDYDDETEGDSGPISRSIPSGPVDNINWMLGLHRLLIGAEGAEWTPRESAGIGSPLSPTNFELRSPSTQGSKPVPAIKVDGRGIFVQKSGKRLFEASYDVEPEDYSTEDGDLTALVPEIGEPGIVRLAVQRQPDTRIHAVLGDGTVAVLVKDPAEQVKCWIKVETAGQVEDVFVLPGEEEDKVYYLVKRTIDGQVRRFRERWALESECRGGTVSKLADCHKIYSGSATDTITGLSHLEGEEVVVWADGKDMGTFTVDSGAITLAEEVENAVVGLGYEGRFKSGKLAYAASLGTALGQPKKITQIGVILSDTHKAGLKFGATFTDEGGTMDDLPSVVDGEVVGDDYVWDVYDKGMVPFPGEWSTDSRLCLLAAAPRPCTVLAAIIGVRTNDKG